MAKFKPGETGNANGRPKKLASAQALRDAFMNDIPEVKNAVAELAKSGDMAAAKLMFDKCYPPLKAEGLRYEVKQGDNHIQTAENIIDAVLKAEIPTDVGSAMMKLIIDYNGLAKLDELQQQLNDIQAQLGIKPNG